MKKQLKKFNEAKYNIELKELNKLTEYVVEIQDLLQGLEVESLEQLEVNLNKQTGFKNTHISASAMSVEIEYNRLLQLEKLIDNRISVKDLNADYSIKKLFLKDLKEKHSTYYSDAELQDLNSLKEVVNQYNKLPIELRGQLIINFNGMQINPFSYLLR